ncbi:hypothetical protein DSO57_1012703 [Entomophthora muscae]|nr:hypothetical protein DSO57_1012703 [Entomophthora muscae]
MVKDFHVTDDETQIGYYVGLIASSFALAQTLTGIPWGILSDRIGRRPVIIMGLFGTAVNLFLFGLSKSLPWAIVTRTLCGLLNGNIGVVKSMMAELTDKTNRAQGFSLLPMMFGLGSIVGPILGGFLSKPVEKYPWLFSGGMVTDFLTTFPYFLPCGLAASLLLMCAIFGLFFLEETMDLHAEAQPQAAVNEESQPLIDSSVNNYGSQAQSSISHSSIESEGIVEPPQGMFKAFFGGTSKNSWMTVLGYSGLSLQTVMMDELLPIWAASPYIYGGLNFSSSDIGTLMAFGGTSLLLIQFLLYTPIHRKLGSLLMFRLSFLFFIPTILLFPISSLLTHEGFKWLLWPVLIVLISARSGCGVFAFTSINILIAETCPNRKTLGMVNGIAQCSGSFMRALGPTLCGFAFSWSLSNDINFPLFKYPFTWIIIALMALTNHLIALQIRTSASPF